MNRGLAFGDGFFTTLRLQAGGIIFEHQHKARLLKTAERLKLPIEAHQIDDIFNQLKQQSSDYPQIVKVLASVASGSKGYQRLEPITLDWQISQQTLPDASDDLKIIQCSQIIPYLHQLSGLKTISALHYVMAANEWSGIADEGLMLDSEGFLIEASMNNILVMRKDGSLWTPNLDKAGISGIFREQLIQFCQTSAIALEVSSKTYQDVFNDCEGFWLINSVRGMRAVIECDNQTINHSESAQLFYNRMNENWQAVCQGIRSTL